MNPDHYSFVRNTGLPRHAFEHDRPKLHGGWVVLIVVLCMFIGLVVARPL